MKKSIKAKPLKKSNKVSKIQKKETKKINLEDKRVSVGIRNFDKLVEGGFEQNSINVIAGGAGSGKSIFATQFLIEGLKSGEPCLYVSFFEKREQFFRNMLEFGWNLEEYERKGLLTFLEYAPEKVKFMLEEGGGSIETVVLTKKIKRLVIDSITSFMMMYQDELMKREATLALYNMIREWNCTALLTYEELATNESKYTEKMGVEPDSVIIVYYVRKGEDRERYLEILKMRGTAHSNKIFKVKIDKQGLFLEDKPVEKESWLKLDE